MNRRGFLQSILVAAAAPAIVRADSLMAVRGLAIPTKALILPSQEVIVPALARGSRIFTAAAESMAFLQAKADGLVELRRYKSATGNVLVDFDLPKPQRRTEERLVFA